MRAYNSAAAPQFFHLAAKTYAAHPVWKGSTTADVKFSPISKKDAVRIFHHARRFERQTATTRVDAFGHRHFQGKVSRMGLLVLHSLLFDFLNYKSGRLDPCYQSIAAAACVSRASVHRALVKLKACGILNWVRRCSGTMDEKRFVLEQDSNAYAVTPATQWKGYSAPPEAPPPDPAAWGAAPPLPALGILAGDGAQRMQQVLEGGGGDKLAAALARLGRVR